MQLQKDLKARYFGLYLNQEVLLFDNTQTIPFKLTGDLFAGIEDKLLLLRSISSLTDGELMELARLRGYVNMDAVKINKEGFFIQWDIDEGRLYEKYMAFSKLFINESDYLRSISIALPYLNYLVEDLTQMGIIKIR